MCKGYQLKVITVLLISAILSLGLTPARAAAKSQSLIIATATTGGTFYPVGVAVGTLLSIKLAKTDKITATAINSAGSGENIQMLKNNECDLAILQGLYGAQAFEGKGSYEGRPMKNMAAITMLWQNVEHFALLSKYIKTGTVSDLKGLDKRFSIGKRGSGSEGSGRTILAALNIIPDKDFSTEYLGYTPSVQAMRDNRVVGANIPAGPPASAITQMYATLGDKASVLNVTDAQLQQINSSFNIWSRFVIPANTYPNQKKAIQTIAQPNLLVVSSELSEETVYKITKTIYENLGFLRNSHKATNVMSLQNAITGMSMPLHPGAIKYYREVGLTIPQHLIAK